MDSPHHRNLSSACLLYRAVDRLLASMNRWKSELNLESDEEAGQMVDRIGKAYEDAKDLLSAAGVLRAQPFADVLVSQLTNILRSVVAKVIDPWEVVLKTNKTRGELRKARLDLVEEWQKKNPLKQAEVALTRCKNQLYDLWLAHAKHFARAFPPLPLRHQALEFFIASSSEGAFIAKKVIGAVRAVRPDWKLHFWQDPGTFTATESTLVSLHDVIGRCDFGIYVLTADDKTVARGKQILTARGNVIFELGLGIGLQDRHRSFIVRSDAYQISDLSGITDLRFKMTKGAKTPDAAECKRLAESIVLAVEQEIKRTEKLWGIG